MSKIFFPQLLPDETIYSLCTRIDAVNLFLDERHSSLYLLGHERGGYHHDIPFGIDRLVQMSKGQLPTSAVLVKERTALAPVLTFLPVQKRRQMLAAISGSRVPNTAWAKVGTSNAGVDGQHFLRRCPDCVQDDHFRHGFTYWHTQHQLLGVWTCPIHGRPLEWLPDSYRKKFAWRQAERDPSHFSSVRLDARSMLLLDCLAKVILWTASMPTISTSVLNILTRSRLRRTGILHTEVKITDAELASIHSEMAAPLSRTGITHFVRYSSPAWIRETLVDSRASHPLRWALLIATTLGEDFFHPKVNALQQTVKTAEDVASLLHCEYQAARERAPQMTLFKTVYSPRITRAPDRLYQALGNAVRVSEAAKQTGLSLNEVRIWIHRDKKLAAHWHLAISEARISEAKAQILAYLQSNPNAQRIDVLRCNLGAIRLLERYSPELLQKLMPSTWVKFAWQPLLPLEFPSP